MLKPYVCDCTPGATAQSCPAEPDSSKLAASHQAATTVVERASAEARLESESDQPSLRALQRNANAEPPKDPLELIDARVDEAVVEISDVSKAEQLQESYGVALQDSDALVFTGNYSAQPGDELVVVRPGKDLSIYGTDSRIGQLALGGDPAASSFAELGVAADQTKPQAVRLVQDGTLQVMLHWREESEEGTFVYKVGVFKVIGPFVGRIFERTLAVSETEDGELRRRGAYEILRGDSHRFIRWIPADDSGELLTEQAMVLKWNRWEGVFRVPKPAPTAPKDSELRSKSPAAPTTGELAER
jgi:hypothetical protein